MAPGTGRPDMCRALKLLCAAPDRERLVGLKRAAVGATWELVGGATSAEELGMQVAQWRPDVVVLDASLGPEAVARVRAQSPACRIVSVGSVDGADAVAPSLEDVRGEILGVPKPGGPVRS
jgi:DNA-binding NarL/FixJ family response regulator